MTMQPTTIDAVAFLKAKLAAAQAPQSAEAQHETAESPGEEVQEHLAGGSEAGEQNTEAGGLEQLLAQLSPEELEQLAAHLSTDIQDPSASEGGEDVASLAHAIQGHLAQNPEASVESADPEKVAALNFVKSASYIEGFLNQAIQTGVSVKQAVDFYDHALTATIENIKAAELAGKQHKLDVDKDGKIEASDLKKLRAGKKHEQKETPAQERAEHDIDSKTAAYYEGVLERAREYGIPDSATLRIVKAANAGELTDQAMALLGRLKDSGLAAAHSAKDQLGQHLGQFAGQAKDQLDQWAGQANDYVQQQNPLHLAAGGLAAGGLGAAGLAALLKSRKKQQRQLEMTKALEMGAP